jgi:hypothetical protein
MDGDLRKRLDEVAKLLSQPPEETDAGADPDVGGGVFDTAKKATGKATSLIDRIKDNIAYVLGLPAAVSGAFGFIWQSSGEEAALGYQVQQLEEAVAELKAENDLLGGGTKNFSLDMSGAPGGSVTVICVAAGLLVLIALLFWYQSKRKKR